MGFFNDFVANQSRIELLIKNNTIPSSVVMKFNNITIGNFVLSNNLIELGTVTLSI